MVRIKEVTTEDKILDLYTVFPNGHQIFFLRLVLKIYMLGFFIIRHIWALTLYWYFEGQLNF